MAFILVGVKHIVPEVGQIAHHGIKPVIDDSDFTLDTLKDALVYLNDGKHTGKVVLPVG